MILRQSMFNALVFSSILLSSVFVVVLGSKLVLSRCERDPNGDCITVDRTADIASEIADLNQQLATARAKLQEECIPPEISTEDWNNGNTEVLEGCWQLDTEFSMRYMESGDKNALVKWEFCLETAGGYALQDMEFEDGLQCINQRLYYEFIDNNGVTELRLSDGQDVPCSGGRYLSSSVIERDLRCGLDSSGNYATCRYQGGSGNPIILRRRR